jgi:hypothetical protein
VWRRFTKGKSISVQECQSLHFPVAQAFRPEVCSRSGVVTVGGKTRTPWKGRATECGGAWAPGRREVTGSGFLPGCANYREFRNESNCCFSAGDNS